MNQKSKRILINAMTLLRIFAIPLFLIIDGMTGFILLNILFLTDYLDGYFARKYNLESETGAILDLVADKFLTIFLLTLYTFYDKLPIWLTLLLVIRELYSIIMRFYYMKKGKELIKASKMGKIKTALFFVAFDTLILNIPGYTVLFLIILVISYYSLFTYIMEGRKNNE